MFTFVKGLKDRSQEGFTLVELMVVVAIIGILSAVAIPNFKQYQAKSKTSEAKLQLASIYTAENAVLADFDTYVTCMADIGYDPSGEVANRYYAVGFTAPFTGTPAQGWCSSTHQYTAGKFANGSAVVAAPTVGTASKNSFLAGASGRVSTANTAVDTWQIDQNKLLTNSTPGWR